MFHNLRHRHAAGVSPTRSLLRPGSVNRLWFLGLACHHGLRLRSRSLIRRCSLYRNCPAHGDSTVCLMFRNPWRLPRRRNVIGRLRRDSGRDHDAPTDGCCHLRSFRAGLVVHSGTTGRLFRSGLWHRAFSKRNHNAFSPLHLAGCGKAPAGRAKASGYGSQIRASQGATGGNSRVFGGRDH